MFKLVTEPESVFFSRGRMKRRRKYVYAFFIVLTLIRTFTLRFFYPEYTLLQQCVIATIGLLFMAFIYEVITGINGWLNGRMPFEDNPKKRLGTQILLCIATTFTLHTLLIMVFRDFLPKEFNRLMMAVSYFIDFVLVFAVNKKV